MSKLASANEVVLEGRVEDKGSLWNLMKNA